MEESRIFLDHDGYEQYLKRIEEAEKKLKDIQRFKGEVAIHQGDGWHDNPTFAQTQLDEQMALRNLNKLKNDLDRIQIVNHVPSQNNAVTIGSIVTISIIFEDEVEEDTVKLVANIPTDFSEVSINSPLGFAILGKHVNDFVRYTVGSNNLVAKIIKIK